MRAARLPNGIRWMGGSIIDTTENGRTVTHGVLTNDPRDLRVEKRVFVPVACETPDEVVGAVAMAIYQLEAESRL